ncbi:MAG: bacterial Ig-like domain-containing protein, partial [Clostridia bacterium]|nr:bacterial Ig-like domain-containing protein [Clostridia bacterium]
LTVSKSDGTTETISVIEDMISGYDSSKAGKQTITVTYEGFTDTYDVEVKEKQVDPTPTPAPKPTNPDTTPRDSGNDYEWGGKTGTISVPDTGDHSNTVLWVFMMSSSLVGLVLSSSWFERRRFFLR